MDFFFRLERNRFETFKNFLQVRMLRQKREKLRRLLGGEASLVIIEEPGFAIFARYFHFIQPGRPVADPSLSSFIIRCVAIARSATQPFLLHRYNFSKTFSHGKYILSLAIPSGS